MDKREFHLRDSLRRVTAAKRARIRELCQKIHESHECQLEHEMQWLRSHTIYPAGSFEGFHLARRKLREEIDFMAEDIASLKYESGNLVRVQVTQEDCRAAERDALEEKQ